MNEETPQQLKYIIEAALLAAQMPLTIDKILSLFPDDAGPTREEARASIDDLAADYNGRGIELKQVDNGFRFQTREDLASYLQKLWEGRPPRYSRALLETLAIIAYRQPVTRGEIEEIRGVSVSSEIIRTLLGREWIRQVGHRDIPGKPALFGTTRGFLEHFNLKSLSELPPLAELRDTESIARELNMRLDLDEGGSSGEGEGGSAGEEDTAGGEQEAPAMEDATPGDEAAGPTSDVGAPNSEPGEESPPVDAAAADDTAGEEEEAPDAGEPEAASASRE
jgi:segregation and condensation protein B